jgi:hypothetical protein
VVLVFPKKKKKTDPTTAFASFKISETNLKYKQQYILPVRKNQLK